MNWRWLGRGSHGPSESRRCGENLSALRHRALSHFDSRLLIFHRCGHFAKDKRWLVVLAEGLCWHRVVKVFFILIILDVWVNTTSGRFSAVLVVQHCLDALMIRAGVGSEGLSLTPCWVHHSDWTWAITLVGGSTREFFITSNQFSCWLHDLLQDGLSQATDELDTPFQFSVFFLNVFHSALKVTSFLLSASLFLCHCCYLAL